MRASIIFYDVNHHEIQTLAVERGDALVGPHDGDTNVPLGLNPGYEPWPDREPT